MARPEPESPLDRLLPAAAYEAVRPSYRRRISAARARRRIQLDGSGSLQFQTREFAVWRTHELRRAGGDARTVQRARDAVRTWCPAEGELTATFTADGVKRERMRAVGDALAAPGAVLLRAGREAVSSEPLGADPNRETVWYLRWRVTPWLQAELSADAPCALVFGWDAGLVTLPPATKAALRTDLVEARVRSRSLLHRLAERQRHVQPPSSGHPARS